MDIVIDFVCKKAYLYDTDNNKQIKIETEEQLKGKFEFIIIITGITNHKLPCKRIIDGIESIYDEVLDNEPLEELINIDFEEIQILLIRQIIHSGKYSKAVTVFETDYCQTEGIHTSDLDFWNAVYDGIKTNDPSYQLIKGIGESDEEVFGILTGLCPDDISFGGIELSNYIDFHRLNASLCGDDYWIGWWGNSIAYVFNLSIFN